MVFQAPSDIESDSFVMIEPNLKQSSSFFNSTITQLVGGKFSVSNTSPDPVSMKKNCQAVILYTTSILPDKSLSSPIPCPSPSPPSRCPSPSSIPTKDVAQILKEIKFDGNLSSSEKSSFIDVISRHSSVFQSDLPGYNNAFGPVHASFDFASKARPVAQKIRSPNYGSIQDSLFNEKCEQLQSLGVLVDPFAQEIQPIMTLNSWVVKKPCSAPLPWEKCSVKDVRLVVGLDPLNKFLKDPPGKVTKTEQIFSSIAGWEFLGEIDFSNCYFQIKFDVNSFLGKQKLGYLCIRTAKGTRCFSRATMGLLGMDVFQDELTDRMFGDLVLAHMVVKLADNIYFGANTLAEFLDIFKTIVEHCDAADLRIKPSKVSLNIQNSDILGLHWERGKLSPSCHKLDPLSVCDPPKTVRGLRSWLGAVRFNEICLPGSQLALFTVLLDEQVPTKRAGKEEIQWNSQLLDSFHQIQDILKSPLSVTVPRKGDTVYVATDACTSLPAGRTKMFVKRPGVQRFLPSFNFGCRLPSTLKSWSPCEVEAFFLNKGIMKAEH